MLMKQYFLFLEIQFALQNYNLLDSYFTVKEFFLPVKFYNFYFEVTFFIFFLTHIKFLDNARTLAIATYLPSSAS